MLCLGGDTPDDLQRQIERAEATGNFAITLDQADQDNLHLPDGIDGVIADGALRERVGALLAKRDGPILPLLSADDADARYWIEKVLTVNTTAAGGNASLLASV